MKNGEQFIFGTCRRVYFFDLRKHENRDSKEFAEVFVVLSFGNDKFLYYGSSVAGIGNGLIAAVCTATAARGQHLSVCPKDFRLDLAANCMYLLHYFDCSSIFSDRLACCDRSLVVVVASPRTSHGLAAYSHNMDAAVVGF